MHRLQKHIPASKAINDALDAIAERLHMEIDEQSNFQFGKSQIGEQLRSAHNCEFIYCLYLNDDGVVDQQIETVVLQQQIW
jgi:hypothetical protein